MTILPIVERELRVAARRRGTYWTRLTVALIAILIGVIVMFENLGAPPARLGAYIFGFLAGFALLHCLFSGRFATADCLSEEKREGTLGLLFLTDLKGYDVVLGKLAATSVNSFYGLLALLPVMAIPLLLGGVTSGQFWRMALVLVNAFLFSLAVGMFGSAISRDARKTMGLNLGLMFFFTLFLPGCAILIAANSSTRFFPQGLCFTSPLYGFFWVGIAPFAPPIAGLPATPPVEFWQSLALIHGLTWLFLFLAARIAPRSWQDQPAPPVRSRAIRPAELWHAWSYGSPAKRPAFRKRLLDLNAFYWLAARARLKPLHVWAFFSLIGVWWLWGFLAQGRIWFDESVNLTMALMLNATLKLWIASEAGQRLADDKKIGALELTLSTPLTARDIARGQFLALRRQFLAPVIAVFALELFLTYSSTFTATRPAKITCAIWLAGITMLLADIAALMWVSMARALIAKNFNRAIVGTLIRILLLPWLGYAAVMSLTSFYHDVWLGNRWEPTWAFQLGWWLAFGLAADLAFGLQARRQILQRLRDLALPRLTPSAPSTTSGPKAFPIPPLVGKVVLSEPPRPTTRKENPAPTARNASFPACESTELSSSVTASLEPGTRNLQLETQSPEPEPPQSAILHPRVFLPIALLLACAAAFLIVRSRPKYPPPLNLPISLSQGPLRVFPGYRNALFILPDGSLWHWGRNRNPDSRTLVPEQVGTSSSWKQVEPAYQGFVGLRNDGSIWQQHDNYSRSDDDLEQVDPGHDWTAVASIGGQSSFALKKDGTIWGWGANNQDQLGNGPGPNQTNLVQVGADSDWMDVQCRGAGTLALKRSGTLWAWGQTISFFKNGAANVTMRNLPVPTQVCSDTNWVGFGEFGWIAAARNRANELWDPFNTAANSELPASAICRLILTNAVPGHYAFGYCGHRFQYELRKDATLWERTVDNPSGPLVPGDPPGEWHQLGKRADWLSLWGGMGTVFGLTSDGALWTWGVDPNLDPAPDFSTRLKMLQNRLKSLFGVGPPPPGSTTYSSMPQYQKDPRPLLKLKP